jgi:hypothetical protein
MRKPSFNNVTRSNGENFANVLNDIDIIECNKSQEEARKVIKNINDRKKKIQERKNFERSLEELRNTEFEYVVSYNKQTTELTTACDKPLCVWEPINPNGKPVVLLRNGETAEMAAGILENYKKIAKEARRAFLEDREVKEERSLDMILVN